MGPLTLLIHPRGMDIELESGCAGSVKRPLAHWLVHGSRSNLWLSTICHGCSHNVGVDGNAPESTRRGSRHRWPFLYGTA